MAISSEQWELAAAQLRSVFASVKFSLDGHTLTCQWQKESQDRMSFRLCVFIDGEIQPSKGFPSSTHFDPFTEKVWRKRTHQVGLKASKHAKAQIDRATGKMKALTRELLTPLTKVTILEYFDPTFLSIKDFIKQYKTLECLEVVEL